MDDSAINPILLSSSAHLENVEQLIRNLEKQTLDLDNFEDILNDRRRQEIITKSFSAVSSSNMTIDDGPEDNFLLKSISLANHGSTNDANLSMDSLFNHRDLFDNDDLKKQQTPPGNDQSVYADHEAAFTWDDQYDARANYRLTFSTDKLGQIDPKLDKPHRHKHHRHRHRNADPQGNSMYSDDGLPANVTSHMNDWSMRSSINALDQSMDQADLRSPTFAQTPQPTSTTPINVIRSQSHPSSFSPSQQMSTTMTSAHNNNNSPNSSTTSSSSSASWRRMKESQRTTSGIETKEARPPSPLSLYKIFQQKSQMQASSSSRSAFQYYRQQSDSIVPNTTDSMTISGEKLQQDRSRASHYHKKSNHADRRSAQTTSNASTDQAIQTSIYVDPSLNSRFQSSTRPTPKSESYDQLASHANSNTSHHLAVPSRPSPAPISSSTVHKSLPDLAFISQYSKELPRSRTTSPCPPPQNTSTSSVNPSPSPLAPPPKPDSDRPRTLKSIKRYKNSKHSTEPLGVFYSPQLGKTFAAVPASAFMQGPNEGPTIIKMKRPPSASPSPSPQPGNQSTSSLKSCLKYGSRANSCDIQAILNDGKSPTPALTIPEFASNRETASPSSKRRCSETDCPEKRPDNLWPTNTHTAGSSNDLNAYMIQELSRGHYSEHDLAMFLQQQQQNQTKKSVSFSENIAKHLISPCNPSIKFDTPSEVVEQNPETMNTLNDQELAYALHGSRESSTRKPTARYGEMRRCQTDIIVMDRVHHLHSFTESPPNEFRFQETDGVLADPNDDDDDDQAIMEKAHVNIIPEPDKVETSEPAPMDIPATTLLVPATTLPVPATTVEINVPFNDKENEIPQEPVPMNASTTTLTAVDDPSLEGLLERITATVKHIFDIKRSEKTFFLTNDNNTRFDSLLKNEFCTNLQQMLEHGLKLQRKDLAPTKSITLWEVIQTSIGQGVSLPIFHEVKQIAQNASPYWLYQFQAFIYGLLNKNELINWLYHFTKQKPILQRYYQTPEALILVKTSSTFNFFDRIMAQLEKLTPLAFRLIYRPPALPAHLEEQLNTSNNSMSSNKSTARDWMRTISRRTSKTLTQPITQPTSMEITPAPSAAAAAAATVHEPTPQSSDTLRSTFTRKINSLFTKNNVPQQPARKPSSAVTAKLPPSKPTSIRSPSPASSHRPRLSNVFANANAAATSTNKPVIVASPKLNNGPRPSSIRRGISPSVVVAPSPPPTLNTTAPSTTTNVANTTFQSKIPRPSLNVDKPKSARYRSTALPPK